MYHNKFTIISNKAFIRYHATQKMETKDDDIPLSDNSNNKEKDITDPQNSKNNPSSSHFQPLNTNRSLLPELNQALENEPESLITPYNKDPLSSEQEIIPSTDPLQKPSSNPLYMLALSFLEVEYLPELLLELELL